MDVSAVQWIFITLTPVSYTHLASGMLSYDNYAQYWENHSKTFVYGSNSVTAWENGVPSSTTYYTAVSYTHLSIYAC